MFACHVGWLFGICCSRLGPEKLPGVPDPFTYNATGVAGNRFTYNTPELTGFDAYKVTLYVDFALMGLTVLRNSLEELRCSLPGRFTRRWRSVLDHTCRIGRPSVSVEFIVVKPEAPLQPCRQTRQRPSLTASLHV